jgi:hypothetical protein
MSAHIFRTFPMFGAIELIPTVVVVLAYLLDEAAQCREIEQHTGRIDVRLD